MKNEHSTDAIGMAAVHFMKRSQRLSGRKYRFKPAIERAIIQHLINVIGATDKTKEGK
jgi:hypothetical protein